VGVLLRLRYAFYMVIVGVGFSFLVQTLIQHKSSPERLGKE
jgi:hypothetical protein